MIINMGFIYAMKPDDPLFADEPEDIPWEEWLGYLGFDVNGEISVRVLNSRIDVPGLLDMHGRAISFHPETKFISIAAPVVRKEYNSGAKWPEYTGSTEVTAIIEAGSVRKVSRAVIDAKDRADGLKPNPRLLP